MSEPDRDALTYAGYLDLDRLLDAQHPRSSDHDELLFIIVHQSKELWLKQMIAELRLAIRLIDEDRPTEAYKPLARVSRIQAVMTLSWDVLATMTPVDYGRFRDRLGTSSGFQSDQFRRFEALLGLETRAHREEPPRSLRCAAHELLVRRGFLAAGAELGGAAGEEPDPAVEAAWIAVYRDAERQWELYQLAEKLVDLDEAMTNWRHRHLTTVARVIGMKRGTGGSAGVPYLSATLSKRAFPELWGLRTEL